MKTEQKKAGRTGKSIFLIVLVSLVYVSLVIGGNHETFLIDDNRTQWYPIMERAYEDLWTTGRIYCYDLYQMKGMSVAEQGYYGIMNPFILLSYGVECLSSGYLPIITVYISLMIVLGNCLVFLVCRRFGCGEKMAFLMTMAYSTLGCFWAFFYWYYVFNNYLMIPLLLYAFLCCRDGRVVYCIFGIILAMDLWMGNVQYTCYHYILFGILCITMMVLKEYRYFGILCANIVTGIIMSLPMFVLLLQASEGFQKHTSFFENPIFYFSLLIHSVIPHGILKRFGREFSLLDSYVMHRDDNLVLYMGMTCIILCMLFVRGIGRGLGRIRKCRNFREVCGEISAEYKHAAAWPREQKILTGCAFTMFFFLSLMGNGVVSYILYILPVVRNFRYLFKAIFVAAPLAVLVLAWTIGNGRENDKSDDRKCWFRVAVTLLMIGFTSVGVVNVIDTVSVTKGLFDAGIRGSFAEEKAAALDMIEAANMDCKNYRTTTFLRFPGINDECFNLSENLSKNFPTAIGVFSLSGYEIAVESQRLESFDAIYSDKDFFAKYANADNVQSFRQSLMNEPYKVSRQLVDNGVRYLLLDKTELADNRRAQEYLETSYIDKNYCEEVIMALNRLPGIQVVRVEEFNNHYDLIEIEGVNSLCMDSDGNMIPLTDLNMETILFDAQTGGAYTLSFGWDRHLKAFLTEQDGTSYPLSIEETGNGNILISTQGRCGEVTLTYHNPICTMGFVWEGIVSLAFVGIMVVLYRKNNRLYFLPIEKTTEICYSML